MAIVGLGALLALVGIGHFVVRFFNDVQRLWLASRIRILQSVGSNLQHFDQLSNAHQAYAFIRAVQSG